MPLERSNNNSFPLMVQHRLTHMWSKSCLNTRTLMLRSQEIRDANSRNEHRNLFISTVLWLAIQITWTWSKRVISPSSDASTWIKRNVAYCLWTSRRRVIERIGNAWTSSSKNDRPMRGHHQSTTARNPTLHQKVLLRQKIKASNCLWIQVNKSCNDRQRK